ncbi:diguanylate cyclase domain-containing protein [Hydrogenophaga sp. OTU3427]|uniref:diguanylate cyclase domain-containing protein n=1 Tax=Hydrogenophaga sp. OTU3427 TaxID=3043856 RepID=UPI00313C0F80
MRFGIATKLGVLLALVGMLAAGITGYNAFQVSRSMLVEAAKDKLLTSTQVLARRITLNREEASRNLMVLAQHPATLAVLENPGPSTAQQVAQLSELFSLLMQVQPAYQQVRLIDAVGYGLERVRVDRGPVGPAPVDLEDLQEKGHFDYVSETLKLPAGHTYMSRLSTSHDGHTDLGDGRPTLQLAMPVVGSQGRNRGVVVINLDVKGMFDLLAQDLPENFRLFFANSEGDILIHPDPDKTFGFDKGRRVLIQDEFPATAAMVRGELNQAVFDARQGAHAELPVVAAFLSQGVVTVSDETRVLLGLAQPLDEVLAASDRLGWLVLQIVGVLCVASGLVALWMGRALTRPINAINRAAQQVASGLPPGELPTERRDEIGALARTFRDMRVQINEQISELRDNQDELEHLAQHDPLTGLPNRRKFQERLDLALAQARRFPQRVCVLFIDLDRFKLINDNVGHDAGDAVLQAVARRLKAMLREVDTVARIGGDEFVVVLGAPATDEQLDAIAAKLLDGLREPVDFEHQRLELGCSIGIAIYPDHAHSAVDLLAAADQAMYRAKTAGRNTYRIAQPVHTLPT